MSFHNIIFPVDIAYGARGGPMFNTTIMELSSGHEKRNINWENAKGRWNVAHGVKTPAQMDTLLAFFYARWGRGFSFLYYDHKDHLIEAQSIGAGDGITTEFQIFKQYVSGIYAYNRDITKTKPDSIEFLSVAEVPQVEHVDFSINELTGIITFNVAPPNGAEIVIGSLEYYVHARFDNDMMDIQLVTYNAESWVDIFIVEVREDEE